MIKTWRQRCEEHPDHNGIVSDGMIQARMQEEIDELRAALEQEPVAWRDHVEQRLLTWRQSFVNKSGDQLALDDFMDKRSLDDLIDFVCDEYTAPRQWKGLTADEIWDAWCEQAKPERDTKNFVAAFARVVEAKLKEKNHG